MLVSKPALAQPLPGFLRAKLHPGLVGDRRAVLLKISEAAVCGVPVLGKADMLANILAVASVVSFAQPFGIKLATLQFQNCIRDIAGSRLRR